MPQAKKTTSKTTVTRLVDNSDEKPKKPPATVKNSPKTSKPTKQHKQRSFVAPFITVFKPIGSYFKGAWIELRQVRWPDRRTTWGMTGALLAFTGFFVVFIMLVDLVFENIFKLILR